MLPNSSEAKLCLQDFSCSISFLLTPGPKIYQSSSLIWTLNYTLNIFKSTTYFYWMNDSQNKNLLKWNLVVLCRDSKNFPKYSCEAHPQNYMYTGPEYCRSIDRISSIGGPCMGVTRQKNETIFSFLKIQIIFS